MAVSAHMYPDMNVPVRAILGSALLRRRIHYLLQTGFCKGIDFQAYLFLEVL
jgi:hypothetical protein